jgi:hypothetical protein
VRPITDHPKPRHATEALLPDGQSTLYGLLHHVIEMALTCIGIARSERKLLYVTRADTGRTVDQAGWPSHLPKHLAPHFDFPLVLLYDWTLP